MIMIMSNARRPSCPLQLHDARNCSGCSEAVPASQCCMSCNAASLPGRMMALLACSIAPYAHFCSPPLLRVLARLASELTCNLAWLAQAGSALEVCCGQQGLGICRWQSDRSRFAFQRTCKSAARSGGCLQQGQHTSWYLLLHCRVAYMYESHSFGWPAT